MTNYLKSEAKVTKLSQLGYILTTPNSINENEKYPLIVYLEYFAEVIAEFVIPSHDFIRRHGIGDYRKLGSVYPVACAAVARRLEDLPRE